MVILFVYPTKKKEKKQGYKSVSDIFLDILKMSIFRILKKVLKKHVFFRVCDHNALNFKKILISL